MPAIDSTHDQLYIVVHHTGPDPGADHHDTEIQLGHELDSDDSTGLNHGPMMILQDHDDRRRGSETPGIT